MNKGKISSDIHSISDAELVQTMPVDVQLLI
jgi:hypothetical protein